jgi:hypothetical protein
MGEQLDSFLNKIDTQIKNPRFGEDFFMQQS